MLFALTVFGRFFHGSGFSGSDPEFLADQDSVKKPDPDKRIRIRNTGLLSQWRAQTLRGRGEGFTVAIPPSSSLDPFQSYEEIVHTITH